MTAFTTRIRLINVFSILIGKAQGSVHTRLNVWAVPLVHSTVSKSAVRSETRTSKVTQARPSRVLCLWKSLTPRRGACWTHWYGAAPFKLAGILTFRGPSS